VGHHRNPPPQSGREPGCVAHRRVAARYARARPLSKPPRGAYLVAKIPVIDLGRYLG